jgi:hypothetical protein
LEENAKERDCLEYIGMSGRMILNQFLEQWDATVRTVFSSFRKCSGGGFL